MVLKRFSIRTRVTSDQDERERHITHSCRIGLCATSICALTTASFLFFFLSLSLSLSLSPLRVGGGPPTHRMPSGTIGGGPFSASPRLDTRFTTHIPLLSGSSGSSFATVQERSNAKTMVYTLWCSRSVVRTRVTRMSRQDSLSPTSLSKPFDEAACSL